MLFSYRSRGGDLNSSQLFKDGAAKPEYSIAFDDGIAAGVTISTAASVAKDSTGSTVTTNCVSASTVSGNSVIVTMKTCGASGTSPAIDGGRFQIITTATLSNSEVLTYGVYLLIQAGAYAPV